MLAGRERGSPDKNDPLLSLDNFIITPHVSLASRNVRQILLANIAKRIENFSKVYIFLFYKIELMRVM